MRFLTNAQYDDLLMRVHRAEGQRDLYELAARDADARYGAIVERYLATDGPPIASRELLTPTTSVALPPDVVNALDDFRSDGELYAYNTRWAMAQLAAGVAPDRVAHAIRFGESADEHAMAVLS